MTTRDVREAAAKPQTRECVEKVHDTYGVGFHRCIRKARAGSNYCALHDPVAVQARQAAREAKWRAKNARNDAIAARAQGLLKRLGVLGVVDCDYNGYREACVISFAEMERLIALRGQPAEGAGS